MMLHQRATVQKFYWTFYLRMSEIRSRVTVKKVARSAKTLTIDLETLVTSSIPEIYQKEVKQYELHDEQMSVTNYAE